MDHDELILRSFTGCLSPDGEGIPSEWPDVDPTDEGRHPVLAAVWESTRDQAEAEATVPPTSGRGRNVTLDGRAFFAVDEERR